MTPSEPPPDLPGGSLAQVPDDARDLHRDVRALQRERRSARRRSRLRRVFLTRRWDRFGLSGPLVVAVLLGVAAYGALPVLLRPDSGDRRPSQALAAPTALPGTVGGLVPEGRVRTPAGVVTTRDLTRPAALLLAPVPCDCERTLSDATTRLISFVDSIRVITPGSADPTGRVAGQLRTGQGRGQIDAGVDLDGVLTAAYAPVGVTVVLVGPDGVVMDVQRDFRPQQPIPGLQRLRD